MFFIFQRKLLLFLLLSGHILTFVSGNNLINDIFKDDDDDSDEDDCWWSCSEPDFKKKWKLSDAAIAGIVIGVVIIFFVIPVALCFCCAWCCFRGRRTQGTVVAAPVTPQSFQLETIVHPGCDNHAYSSVYAHTTHDFNHENNNAQQYGFAPQHQHQQSLWEKSTINPFDIYERPPPYYDVTTGQSR